MSDSYIYWKGLSELNGEPIILILTGIKNPSQNRKTGPMVQSYILKEGIKPTEDRKEGAFSVCGECPIKSACYVGDHYLNNIYDGSLKPKDRFPPNLLKGRTLRVGAYGDPAAVPYQVWNRLIKSSEGWTGYTHQWRTCDQQFRHICMASVESEEAMREAWEKGWKTYRVGLETEFPVQGEMDCPYYIFQHEPKMQCIQCQLCSGDSIPQKNGIFVRVHGNLKRKKNFEKLKEANEVYPDIPKSSTTHARGAKLPN